MNPEAGLWKVLLVDDEPMVHEVSRLILAGLRFEEREIELLVAGSAAEARELLGQHPDVALALVDVVMETDDAGLLLVQHIRQRLGNADMQIVLRTGQPGVAPEADVMHGHEINGYFLKTEITAQRLNSIVITGLRAYRHTLELRAGGMPAAAVERPRDPLQDELAALDLGRATLLQVQPEVALASYEIVGVELVPQWRSSAGLLTAARVRQAAGDGQLAERFAHALLEQALFWARAWSAALGRPLRVSVPLVGDTLAQPDASRRIAQAVRAAGLAPGTLDLLVVESTLLASAPAVRPAVEALRAAGVTLTLNDFGASTISLPQLSGVVPDRLKLHRLFVRGITQQPERMAVARSLIALAQTLHAVSIADGIASAQDAQFFKWEGCELGQGDALAPACAPAELTERVLQGRAGAH
ncbi:hypothetical protein CLD22_21810 [Rubrivivax gelatinosus]|nr:hypothetical protein [Rubrivivax gelatinosus]